MPPSAHESHTTVFRNPLITQTDAAGSDNTVKVSCVLHSLLEQATGYALAKRLDWAAKEEIKEKDRRN